MYDYFTPPAYVEGTRPLVLFSGGVDSAARLLDLVKNGVNVDVVAIDAQVHPKKVEIERKARCHILTELKRTYPNVHVDCFGEWGRTDQFDFEPIHQHGMCSTHFSYNQMLPWIVGALKSVRPRTSHVEICYVLGDDAINALPFLAEAFRCLSIAILGREVKVYFPCANTRKQGLYKTLSEHVITKSKRRLGRRATPMQRIRCCGPTVTLLDLTWVCEMPRQHRACGNCPACERERDVRKAVGLKPRAVTYRWLEEGPNGSFCHNRQTMQIRARRRLRKVLFTDVTVRGPGHGNEVELESIEEGVTFQDPRSDDTPSSPGDLTDIFNSLNNLVKNLDTQSA
jgi:7-cyano-7-deazaguanine synthase in queuosine biosynthesis